MPGVQFLGTFKVGADRAGRCPGIGPAGRETVAYLFHNANRLLDRDEIIDRFWVLDDLGDAKSALNSTTSRLRRALSHPDISRVELRSDKWSLGVFVQDNDVSDVALLAEIYRQLKIGEGDVRRHYDQIIQLYRGEYMPGHANRWTLLERERLQGLFVRSTLLITDQFMKDGALDDAADGCRSILTHDLLRESVHRRLLLLHALRGEGQKIRQHYKRLENLLWAECKSKPTHRTRSLFEALCEDPSPQALETIFAADTSSL